MTYLLGIFVVLGNFDRISLHRHKIATTNKRRRIAMINPSTPAIIINISIINLEPFECALSSES
jgi:hypothetical protein